MFIEYLLYVCHCLREGLLTREANKVCFFIPLIFYIVKPNRKQIVKTSCMSDADEWQWEHKSREGGQKVPERVGESSSSI